MFQFTKTKPECILKLLKKIDLEYEPCDYPTYRTSKQPMENFKLELTNRFESENVEVDENFYQNLEPFLLTQSTDESSELVGIDDSETPEEDGCWLDVIHKNVDKIESIKRQRQIPCKWKEHCSRGTSCRNHHSEKELDLFRRHPKVNFRCWKTRQCRNLSLPHKTEMCIFANCPEDSWSLNCRMYAHLTSECRKNRQC